MSKQLLQRVTQGKRTDAVANRARILEAARAILAERGLDMEVNEVAERASVGVGTLYRHFANRDDLVRAILSETFEGLVARVRSIAAIEDPAAALRQIPFMLDESVSSLFVTLRDPRAAKLLQDVKQRMSQPLATELIELIAGIVERGVRMGAFRADLDPPATAAAILGSIGAVCETLGATRPLEELAGLLADLHSSMVAAR
ncbi:MAG TPA: TetR family transcriptional regulator [Chloroflexota bacterium]|nr:TetR family transcriptional regulator [Chloroflexota bacterium]